MGGMPRDGIDEHAALLGALALASLLVLLASAAVMPWVVIRIPQDYFSHPARPRRAQGRRYPIVRFLLLAGKNLAGAVLIAAGLAMLVLPGQGLLTLLVGVFLIDFPGKYALERWLVSRPGVLRAINALRTLRGRAPLEIGG